jgi:hypothetical protein
LEQADFKRIQRMELEQGTAQFELKVGYYPAKVTKQFYFGGIALRVRAVRFIFFSKRMLLPSLIRPCRQIRFATYAPASRLTPFACPAQAPAATRLPRFPCASLPGKPVRLFAADTCFSDILDWFLKDLNIFPKKFSFLKMQR